MFPARGSQARRSICCSFRRSLHGSAVLVGVLAGAGCAWDWDVLEQRSMMPVSLDLTSDAACVEASSPLVLSWSSEGATECIAMGPGWEGSRAIEGREEITTPMTGLYSMRCIGPRGEASDSVMALVDPGTAPVDAITAPYATRDLTDRSTVEWQTERHLAEELQEGTYPGSRDLVGTFRVAWDADRLYVTASVVDDDLQFVAGMAALDHDLVEVMINGRNDEPYRTPAGGLRFDVDDHRLAFSPEGVLWTTDPSQPRGEDVVQQAFLTASGYELEVGVRWPFVVGTDAHVPSPGDLVGFNLAVVDKDDGEDPPPSTVIWRLSEFRWRNTTGWGTVVLRCALQP